MKDFQSLGDEGNFLLIQILILILKSTNLKWKQEYKIKTPFSTEFLCPVRCSEHPATLFLSCHSPKRMHFPVCLSQILQGVRIQKENHKKISKETFCRVTFGGSAWKNNALGLFAGNTGFLTQPVKQTKGISKTNTVFTKMFHKFSDWLYTLLIHQSPKAE